MSLAKGAGDAIPDSPIFNLALTQKTGSFFEVWFFKINHPAEKNALWLRFSLLVTANGFKKIAEVWAIYSERDIATREVNRVFARQAVDLQTSRTNDSGGIQIGNCEWGSHFTRGTLVSKGNSIHWNLKFEDGQKGSFSAVPDSLFRTGLIKNKIETAHEDLLFTGVVTINGKTQNWTNLPGMRGNLSGPRNGRSWIWAHCNSFVDEQKNEAPFIFEGLTTRPNIMGRIPGPEISSFYFMYRGKEYAFNTLWAVFRSHSQHSLTEWEFHAHRGEISFRGEAKAELKDFSGLTYEDTDGSLLYCANSTLSDLKIHVYRHGKIESSFYALGTATFEVASRIKNPYVPALV